MPFDEDNQLPRDQTPGPPGRSLKIRQSDDGHTLYVSVENSPDELSFHLQGEPGKDATIEQIRSVLNENIDLLRGEDGHTPTADEINRLISEQINANPERFRGQPGKDGTDGEDGTDGNTPTGSEITTLIKNVIAAAPESFRGMPGKDGKNGDNGVTPSNDDILALVNQVITQNPDRFRGKDGHTPTNEEISSLISAAISADPARFKGLPGEPGRNATDTQIAAAVSTYMTNNASLFKGPKGDPATDAQVQTAANAYLAANVSMFRGIQGIPGDSRIKYDRTHDVAAQSTGSYTLPAINIGKFNARPVVHVTVEAASGALGWRPIVTGDATNGYSVSVAIWAMKSTLDISLGSLIGINLFAASLPAMKVHITGMEPL